MKGASETERPSPFMPGSILALDRHLLRFPTWLHVIPSGFRALSWKGLRYCALLQLLHWLQSPLVRLVCCRYVDPIMSSSLLPAFSCSRSIMCCCFVANYTFPLDWRQSCRHQFRFSEWSLRIGFYRRSHCG